jgi:hypothetical protein
MPDEQQSAAEKKITLTISTLSGDYTHPFAEDVKLKHVVKKTIDELRIVGEGPWILEYDGAELDQEQTIKHAKLKDGDVLTLNPEEGGGGSSGR